jgi:hypothetical protein
MIWIQARFVTTRPRCRSDRLPTWELSRIDGTGEQVIESELQTEARYTRP